MEFIFFVRNYKFDLLTAFFAVAIIIVSFCFSTDQRIIAVLSVLVTLISVSLIIFLRLREKDFYFVALTKRQDKDEWIGRGEFEFRRTSNAYLVTNSSPGYIFSKALNWSDYRFKFEFNILNICLGAIVRAVNLSDYLMFQIRDYGIRPHIRINGGWKPWEAKDANLEFEKKLSLDKWYQCTITCEKDLISIYIECGDQIVLNRSWAIPHEHLGIEFRQDENDPKPIVIPFPINLDYGTIGFRNFGNEKALVKHVLIEKL